MLKQQQEHSNNEDDDSYCDATVKIPDRKLQIDDRIHN